jgi:hypothetical protein
MEKTDWQILYQDLNELHKKFYFQYKNYSHGKNKTIRAIGEREVSDIISRTKRLIAASPEAYTLLTGGPESDDYSRAIIYDEFFTPRYFGKDMGNFLDKIKEIVKNSQ